MRGLPQSFAVNRQQGFRSMIDWSRGVVLAPLEPLCCKVRLDSRLNWSCADSLNKTNRGQELRTVLAAVFRFW